MFSPINSERKGGNGCSSLVNSVSSSSARMAPATCSSCRSPRSSSSPSSSSPSDTSSTSSSSSCPEPSSSELTASYLNDGNSFDNTNEKAFKPAAICFKQNSFPSSNKEIFPLVTFPLIERAAQSDT